MNFFLSFSACAAGGEGGARRLCRETDDRIVYGTGQVVASAELEAEAEKIFALPGVTYVHVRSAQNNCYTCRIERG